MNLQPDGGTLSPLTVLDKSRNGRSHRWPQITADGRWVLVTVGTLDSPGETRGQARRFERYQSGSGHGPGPARAPLSYAPGA